jgi:hypothetical protein
MKELARGIGNRTSTRKVQRNTEGIGCERAWPHRVVPRRKSARSRVPADNDGRPSG